MLVLFIVFVCSCEKDIEKPQSDFSAIQSSSNPLEINFTDLSTNNPTNWEWHFEGGKPETSSDQNPTITYLEPGCYNVTLIAKNEGGKEELIKYAYVNIIQFVNPLYTDMTLTFDNRQIIIPAQASTKFAVIENYLIDCHIETQGNAPSGVDAGLLIFWDWSIDLSEYWYYLPWLSSDYIFFYITNNSQYNLSAFHVNCGNPYYESFEEFTIQNNGIRHGIGYYEAFKGMEVRSYFTSGYIFGIEPTSLYIPWELDQHADLIVGTITKSSDNISTFNLSEKNVEYSELNSDINAVIQKIKNNPKTKILTQTSSK